MLSVPQPYDNDVQRRTDAAGVLCQIIELHTPFTVDSATNIFITPNRCIVLTAAEGIAWTEDALAALAYRVAGRCPLDFSALPEPMAGPFAEAVAAVLDWRMSA